MKEYFSRMKPKSRRPQIKPFTKILWSGLTSFIAIYLISELSRIQADQGSENIYLIGSFGASAVLLYGVPNANFSQPRNVIGGHFLSALIGVTVYNLLPLNITLAASLSVSLSIISMHLTNTMHPPGGATALIAVIGGPLIHNLGYKYALIPVLTGSIILTLIAIILNNFSKNTKRHYPEYYI